MVGRRHGRNVTDSRLPARSAYSSCRAEDADRGRAPARRRPARESELFLVDGNNLAYRAFFALPEELATTEGIPTNALLGFTNMLFKLLVRLPAEGRRRRVGLAARRRAAAAEAAEVVYKEGRRPMPDLLREQFPHFRPIVEAFGYSNLEFEGWEADDVIATLATRADAAGIKTCVVSTDRDAFQLARRTSCLMMTPRGVADVNVYTPERVELRYGIRPEQIPDFIGLKGDSSDNIPGIPGIGDKTAGQLIAQYGSLESVIEHARSSRRRAARTSPSSRIKLVLQRDCHDAPRPRPRLRPVRGRARAAGSLRAEGDLPPLRVPRPALARRHAGRGAARRADGRRPASRCRGARG